MANWCSNNLIVSHKDPKMMKKFERGIAEENLFQTFAPLAVKKRGDLETQNEYWGTGRDVKNGYFELSVDGLSGSGSFETAWSPPIGAYEKLDDLGFQIQATYHESGADFAGTWDNENGDERFEYDFEDEDWREQIYNPIVLEIVEAEYEIWKEDAEG